MKVHCSELTARVPVCGVREMPSPTILVARKWIRVSKERRCKNCQRVMDARKERALFGGRQ